MEEKSNLKNEYDFYLRHKNRFLKEYEGKYIVIKDEKILGSYSTFEDAINETTKTYKLGTFLVKLCLKEEPEMKYYNARIAWHK